MADANDTANRTRAGGFSSILKPDTMEDFSKDVGNRK
jgi:hypothetical protein